MWVAALIEDFCHPEVKSLLNESVKNILTCGEYAGGGVSGPNEKGDWGLWPEDATLPGLGTLDIGDRGEELVLMKGGGNPF